MARKIGLAVAGGLLAAVGLVAPATAAPSNWSEQWFFDGAGNHVGTRYVNCSYPFIVTEGTVTTNRVVVASGPC